jgi:nucleotide-binding universal stress UspA family protein
MGLRKLSESRSRHNTEFRAVQARRRALAHRVGGSPDPRLPSGFTVRYADITPARSGEEDAMPASAFHRILVPVDFSPCSRAALDYATKLAEQTHANVEVLYVEEPTSYVGPDNLAFAGEERPNPVESRNAVVREIEGFLGPMKNQVRDVRVEPGAPGDVIAAVAREGAFDLIVMGTHGRSGLSRLVVGSVAESVMRKAPVPVLTLKMPQREAREAIPL